jgi:hypothetical protein
MKFSRRGFLSGLGAVLAAPAVVRAANLMPVRGIIMPAPLRLTLTGAGHGLHAGDLITFPGATSLPQGLAGTVYRITTIHRPSAIEHAIDVLACGSLFHDT